MIIPITGFSSAITKSTAGDSADTRLSENLTESDTTHESLSAARRCCPHSSTVDLLKIANNEQGRLFAVVHISGKQFKITEGDIIIVEGYWPPTAGDKIKLEKTMLVGSKDFTLIGTPLLQDGLVDIYATVIEKTLSHTKTNFKKKRRKQYTNINFYRVQQTMLRINQIVIKGTVDSPPDVTGLEHCIL